MDQPGSMNEINTNEERLRTENEDLKRQLAKIRADGSSRAPSAGTLLVVIVLALALGIAGFYLGYLPRQQREMALAKEVKSGSEASPVVNVARVTKSESKSSLVLPGNIQAVTE